jgi:hypothetical protein
LAARALGEQGQRSPISMEAWTLEEIIVLL